MSDTLHRRCALAGLCAAAAAALAGCTASFPAARESTAAPPDYDRLRRTPTHVASAVDLSLPDGVPRAETPDDAALVVLPAETPTDAGTAVDWLVAGTGVALLGRESEPTLHRWQGSDAYRDAFDRRGRSDADPDPELLVAFAVGREYVTTYRYTWGHTDDPSDEELLEALEAALAGEAEDGRPRGRGTAGTGIEAETTALP